MSSVFFDEKADILDLRYDKAFKAVFTRDDSRSRKALNGLLSACIGHGVSVLNLTPNEPPPDFAGDKQIRYDIACRLDTKELADVEMTLYPSASESLREEYYATRLFSRQKIRGSKQEYQNLKNVYQINILASGIRYKDESLIHTFRFYDEKNFLSFEGKTHIITVELAKVEKLVREKAAEDLDAVEAWAAFFRYHTEKEKRVLVNELLKQREDIAMAGENILEFSQEEIEWFYNESKLKYELDMQDMQARYLREGREEGRQELKRENALKMKEIGLSSEQIKTVTGLSAEEIEKL
jgi:predicted transposase/invertase (TIGR01784 family)